MFDLVLQNAQVVTPNGVRELDVCIADERIAALVARGTQVPAKEQRDLSGKIILPGAIDTHSHLTFYGTMAEGTRTAASGGVTTVIEMPTSNTLPYVMDRNVFQARIEAFDKVCVTDYALFAGVSPLNIDGIRDFDGLGAAAFKVFLSDAGDYRYFTDFDLYELFLRTSGRNALVSIHAETETICAGYARRYRENGGNIDQFSASRPIISEVLAVGRLARLCLETGARANVCHISAPQVVEELELYRRQGARVTAETCPHYLTLTQEDIVRCGAFAKCQPPLRDQAAVDGLWDKVINGGIDIIGSDHATYSEVSKLERDFWDAPGGFPGLDLLLPTLISEGVHKRGLRWERLAEVSAGNAAKTFGLAYRKGSIEIGKDADLAIVDPLAEWTFRAKNSYYCNRSSRFPYEGRRFKGKVIQTYVRGRSVYENGEIAAAPGGRFVPARHTGPACAQG